MESVAVILADIDRIESMLEKSPSELLWNELDRLVLKYMELTQNKRAA